MRLDQGHPIPELVVEILSPTTRAKDSRGKMHLYADLGIAEYLTCDPGGDPAPDAPAELLFFRLQSDGSYRQDERAAAYFSAVCDTHMRLWQPDARKLPRFQWWDAGQDRWRDQAADAEFERDRHVRELQDTRTASREEGEARGRAEERLNMAADLLHKLLPDTLLPRFRDRLEAHWREHGPPPDVMDRALAVRETPTEWRPLLQSTDENDDRGSDHTPPPREPRPPRNR